MPTLNWIGKDAVINHHHDVPFKTLDQKYTFGAEKSENKIIHGDNLEALKALLPEYEGKIKCIYIDPPYNTGNENWVYNDNVNSPRIRKWLGQVVGKEAEDLTRHDKWLCMMYPRLKLLHQLLANDGAIFISIDDNEQANLKLICDEIFGSGNFRNTIAVKRGTKSVQAQFENIDKLGIAYEFILVYTKNSNFRLPLFFFDLEEKRDGTWNNHWRGTDRPTMRYELFGITPEKGQWRWSRERSLNAINNYNRCIEEIKRENKEISQKNIDEWYLSQNEGSIDLLRVSINGKPEHYIAPTDKKFGHNLWIDLQIGGSNDFSKYQLEVFNNPKNPKIIERIISWFTDKSSIILDSFAGSGTTAHAVLNLNKQDGGNRKFILVEMEDYAETITAERVRRVISGYGRDAARHVSTEGTGGAFTYYELGEPMMNGDYLNENQPIEKIREYIWYSETHIPYCRDAVHRVFTDNADNAYHLGNHNNAGYYFYYEKNTTTTLDKAFLNTISQPADQYIIYADNCLLSDEFMRLNNIVFKKIPRDIRKF